MREQYKIAVLYIGPGQSDRDAILHNTMGSADFTELIEGLGWTVSLSSHKGYNGGLKMTSGTFDQHRPSHVTSVKPCIQARVCTTGLQQQR